MMAADMLGVGLLQHRKQACSKQQN